MIQEIDPSQLAHRLKGPDSFKIVDVREPSEYVAGHIPGAINVPLGQIEDVIPGIAADQEIVMVCRVGARSMKACIRVEESYPQLTNLEGGTMDWIAMGYPVVTGDS